MPPGPAPSSTISPGTPSATLAPARADTENPGGFTHVPALDGIRGLAILLILYVHLFWSNTDTGNGLFDFFSALRASAWVGVNLFFALSGFLITGILLDTVALPNFFRIFYARRSLRIFPLYYGFLALMFLLTRPLHLHWNGWQYYYLTYTANLVLWTRPAYDLPHFNITHFWSLQVEEQFYLVWPFVVFHIRKLDTLIRTSLLVCGVVLAIRIAIVLNRAHSANLFLPYSPTFACVDNLLFGCCLCALLRTPLRAQVLRLAPPVLAVCAALLVVPAWRNHGLQWETSTFIPTFGFTLVGLASTATIAMTLRTGSRAQHFFSNPILRFFGKYSYGLYLFHYSIQANIDLPLRKLLEGSFHNKLLAVSGSALAVLLLSIAAALLSFHLYEAHFLKLKRFFSYTRARPAPAT